VVGYPEAHHITGAEELIESCRIIRGMLHNSLRDFPDMPGDARVRRRKEELVGEAKILLGALKELGKGSADPWSDPDVFAGAIETGLLDAPHLKNNPCARGEVTTRMIGGKCCAVDARTGKMIFENERLKYLKKGDR